MSADDQIREARGAGKSTVLPEDECWVLLSTTTVGRIAFVDDDGVQLLPLNFVVIDKIIYVRTATDTVLAGLANSKGNVAFEVDHHAEFARDGWNVTVKGQASRIDDPAMLKQVSENRKLRPWAGGSRTKVFRVVPSTIDGRRVTSH